MKFPVALHKDPGSAFGVTVPDVPGCHAAGDTIEDALTNARRAILTHVKTLADTGRPLVVVASSIEDWHDHPDHAGAQWALVDVDL